MSKYVQVPISTYDDGQIDSDLFIQSLQAHSIGEKLNQISTEIQRFKMNDYDDSPYSRGYLDGLETTYDTATKYGD